MNEMSVIRAKSNVETSRREALEISNKNLKQADKNNLTASKENEGSPSVCRSNDSNVHLAVSETHSQDHEPGHPTAASVKSGKEDHTYDMTNRKMWTLLLPLVRKRGNHKE